MFTAQHSTQFVNTSHATSELDLSITAACHNHGYQCWVDVIVSGCASQIITQFCFSSPTPTVFPYQTKDFPVLPLVDRSRSTPVVVIAGCTCRVCCGAVCKKYVLCIKATSMYLCSCVTVWIFIHEIQPLVFFLSSQNDVCE